MTDAVPVQARFNGGNHGSQMAINHGCVENHFHPASAQEDNFDYVRPFGLCLGQAPYIDARMFIGREVELTKIAETLVPDNNLTEQHRLVLGGTGGVGKTQLAIAYAKHYQNQYSSIFWLNAASETSLKASFQLIAEQVFNVQEHGACDNGVFLKHIKRWLSHSENQRWLLIFDNYDEPDLYDIEDYYPLATHGSVIITTRLPDQVSGQPVILRHLQNVDQSLQILETRSQRQNIANDPYARRLAERLDGFPLALATAGAYLRKSTSTFERYLQDYEQRWKVNVHQPVRLQEYKDRTLYTTWDLSYQRLKDKVPEAAQLLRLFAYFDHQAIWYDLLKAGAQDKAPEWLKTALDDSAHFESLMSVLVDYCFVETNLAPQAYSLHTCVHDWTLAGLNRPVDPKGYWYAFDCIYQPIMEEKYRSLNRLQYARFVPHAIRLLHRTFDEILEYIEPSDTEQAICIAELLVAQFQLIHAETMYLRVLLVAERALGTNHDETLRIANNLGLLYMDQNKLTDAEVMCKRALVAYEEVLGPNHLKTLKIVNNLGLLYMNQNKLTDAEMMYKRALAGFEEEFGTDHLETLDTVHNLGILYRRQDKLIDAEAMYRRALVGREEELGLDHLETLNTVNNLGVLYNAQGKLVDAEMMYKRALAGFEEALGPDHPETLDTVNNLGLLYSYQGKLREAEEMYIRALTGYQKSDLSGSNRPLNLCFNLGLLYVKQGKTEQAKHMFERAKLGYERVHGPEHADTLDVVDELQKLDLKDETGEESSIEVVEEPHQDEPEPSRREQLPQKSRWRDRLSRVLWHKSSKGRSS